MNKYEKNTIKMSVINVKSQTDLSGFYIVYKGSVRNEKKGWYGISHLMEHLICHSFDDMLNDFSRDGISWNAYTSNNEIVFHFTGLDEYLSKYKEKVLKRLLNFSITKEQFENEKKIVIEEYKDYFNEQSSNHCLNLFRKLFNFYAPIGLIEDLENLKYQDVKDFYEIQFTKPHNIINISKHSPFSTDIKFSNVTYDNKIALGNYDVTIEPYKRNDKSSIIYLSEVIDKDFAYIEFITNMLAKGLQSPLYKEIREKRGLVYYVTCSLYRMTDKSGLIIITTQTSNDNVKEIEKLTNMVLSNPTEYMTIERFNIIKQNTEILLKKSEINRYENASKYFIPQEWSVENIIKDLTYEKIMEVYNKYFDFSKFIKSVDTIDF